MLKDRIHGVKDRDRRPGFDSNRNRYPRKPAAHPPPQPADGTAHPRRTKFLQALIKQVADGDLIEFAALADLPVTKIRSLSEGEPLSDELAFHLKEVFSLPAKWAETGELERVAQEESKKVESQEPVLVGAELALAVESSAPAVSAPTPTAPPTDPSLASNSQSQMTTLENRMTATQAQASTKKPRVPVDDDSDDVVATRQANLNRLTSWHGAKKRLAAVLGEDDQLLVTYLLSGRKKFWGHFAKAIEKAVDLPSGWFSTPDLPIPPTTMQIMQSADPAHPNPVKILNVPTRKYTRKAAPKPKGTNAVVEKKAAAKSQAPAEPAPGAPVASATPSVNDTPVQVTAAPAPAATVPAQVEAPSDLVVIPPVAANSASPVVQLGQVICSLINQRISEGSLSTGVAYKVLGLLVEDR